MSPFFSNRYIFQPDFSLFLHSRIKKSGNYSESTFVPPIIFVQFGAKSIKYQFSFRGKIVTKVSPNHTAAASPRGFCHIAAAPLLPPRRRASITPPPRRRAVGAAPSPRRRRYTAARLSPHRRRAATTPPPDCHYTAAGFSPHCRCAISILPLHRAAAKTSLRSRHTAGLFWD